MSRRDHAVNIALINTVLELLGRQELEADLVEAYLIVGRINLANAAALHVRRLVAVAVESIDQDKPAARRRVSELAAEPSSPRRPL
jgi:hypothetical protein